jgi:cysteine-rich repeat protein
VVEPPEDCDDAGESAVCDADCTAVDCGDGTRNATAGEECDDGNNVDGDGCEADCSLPAPQNLVSNGDFSAGESDWVFSSNGTATFDVVAGEAVIDFAVVGSKVQLYQPGIALEGNTNYRLTFRGRSTAGHDVIVRMIEHEAPYTNCGLRQTVNLKTADQMFVVPFTTPPGPLGPGRFVFWFSRHAADGDVYRFDDVVIEKVP